MTCKQILWCGAMALLVGCAATGQGSSSARPVLYPNVAFQRLGEAGAQRETDACIARAQAAGLTPYENNHAVAQRAGQGAAVGGVAAAVGALVSGRNTDSVVRAGAAGAAVGGAAGAVSGALRDSPSTTYRQFVQRCLAEQGLDVIGWR